MRPTPLTVTLLVPFLLPVFAPGLLAQDREVLIVEKREDLAARDRLLAAFASTRVSVHFEAATAEELVAFLHAATGKKVNFLLSAAAAKEGAVAPVSLRLDRLAIPHLLGVLGEQAGLAFVFRDGVVFLELPEAVKPLAYLRLYDVRSAVVMVRDFPGPRLGLRSPGEEPPIAEESEPRPLNGYDIDALADLVRRHAATGSWERDGISIEAMNGILLVRQTVQGHAAVRRFLAQLGAIPAPSRARVRTRVRPPGPLPRGRSR